MRRKKGQAALEFLMTYGWALLVVFVVIGTLAYFGILDPSFLLPEKCTLQLGMYCKDHRIDIDKRTVNLRLKNNIGNGAVITRARISDSRGLVTCDVGVSHFYGTAKNATCNGVTCTSCGNFSYTSYLNASLAGSYYGCNPSPNFREDFNGNVGWRLGNDEEGTIIIPCSNMGQLEGKVKLGISLVYFYEDSTKDFLHTMTGELLAKAESINLG